MDLPISFTSAESGLGGCRPAPAAAGRLLHEPLPPGPTGPLVRLLQADTFTVPTRRAVPTNDARIALGQAVVAAAQIAVGQ